MLRMMHHSEFDIGAGPNVPITRLLVPRASADWPANRHELPMTAPLSSATDAAPIATVRAFYAVCRESPPSRGAQELAGEGARARRARHPALMVE